MLISKHFDPVMGIDIHFLIIPPAGPVPIPHPHIALVFDPFDYVPFIGATVKVGGLPRSTAGTAGKPIPHIPMGGPFAKPPMNENEIFMGSVTVLADGGPLSYTAVPSLSCHDIGLIAPPRKKKPKKSFGMVLPTSVVLSIPLGMPVMVGGAPTIDMMGLAMMGGFAALGGAFKKLRKMQKKSPRMKKISSAIHNRAKKAMDKLGVPPNIRNKVHKNICTVTGHPVDVATGKMFTDHVDFSLPGPLPLVWERTWYSTSVYDGPLGHGWHHSYDLELCEMDNAVAVRLADGRSVAFPALHINEKSFDRQERMTLLRDAEGYALDTKDKQRYRFTPFQGQAEKQLLTSLSQTTSGATIYFYYNEQAQLQQIIDSGGRLIQFSHTDDGRIHKIFLPEPESNLTRDHTQHKSFCAVEHHYRNGMLVQVDDALQQPLQYHYDNTLLIKETFRSGLSFYFEYDGLDHNARCLRTWGDGGIYYRDIRYDTGNNITYVKNSHGHLTTYYHNGVLPHRVVDPLNHATSIEYNSHFDVIGITNPLGHKIQYQYNFAGSILQITDEDGYSTRTNFDEQQNPIEIIDRLGNTWRYEYDKKNRLVSEINPLQQKQLYFYDDEKLIEVTDENGNSSTLNYDLSMNISRIVNTTGTYTNWNYDQLGNIIRTEDDKGNQWSFKRDRLGRVIKTYDADGNIREANYDPLNNLIHYKDLQQEVSFTYSGLGRTTSRSQNGITVFFSYDTEEQLVAITNADQKDYRFILDANGEVISESGFDGLTRHYRRDPCGQQIQVNYPSGKQIRTIYDPIGRIIKRLLSDNTEESFTYRPDGALAKATNQWSSVEFEHDELGRLTKESQGGHWVASTYDKAGLRVNLKSSFGLDQKITRDEHGDVLGIKTADEQFYVDFKRDSVGLEIQRDLPGGIQSRWNRDKLGRPIQHELTTKAAKSQLNTYIWGSNERLLKVIDKNQRETVFQYDLAGALTSARYENNTFDLRMPDAVGNLFKTTPKNDRKYGAAGQLTQIKSPQGNIYFEYDEDGNLIKKREADDSVWLYEWNCSGMMVKVIRPDKQTVEFKYDALGRRIRKSFANKITHWVWDGDNPLHEWKEDIKIEHKTKIPKQSFFVDGVVLTPEVQGQIKSRAPPENEEGSEEHPVTWLFEPESHAPLAKLTKDNCYSIITNHVGIPLTLFDKEGEQIWAASMNTWGELRTLQGERFTCPFRGQGQYEDEETGLYYNRYRYFDPVMGMYVSQDPIRLHGGMELYAYVANPLIWTDPLGLAKCHYNGERGRKKAMHDLERNGYTIVAEEVTMKVNKSRIRADFVARDGHGNLHVFEVKHGTGALTKNQKKANVFDMSNPSNPVGGIGGGTIKPSNGTKDTFSVATKNRNVRALLGARGTSHSATFHVLKYS